MLRPLFCEMAVLALLSPAIASAQPAGALCHATPQEGRREVPWAGNTGDIQWSADQADCKVDAGSLKWVTVSVLPPVSGSLGQRILRYSVDTNFSPAAREGKIRIGDAAVTIAQAAGPAPGMAYSPTRLEFQFIPGKDLVLEATKPLYVGSEEPLVFTATPDKSAPWMRIKASGSGDNTPSQRRSFEVTVSAQGRDPGIYQGDILIEAPGASNPKELIPVTMTIGKESK
jgi:hypothetical protein